MQKKKKHSLLVLFLSFWIISPLFHALLKFTVLTMPRKCLRSAKANSSSWPVCYIWLTIVPQHFYGRQVRGNEWWRHVAYPSTSVWNEGFKEVSRHFSTPPKLSAVCFSKLTIKDELSLYLWVHSTAPARCSHSCVRHRWQHVSVSNLLKAHMPAKTTVH